MSVTFFFFNMLHFLMVSLVLCPSETERTVIYDRNLASPPQCQEGKWGTKRCGWDKSGCAVANGCWSCTHNPLTSCLVNQSANPLESALPAWSKSHLLHHSAGPCFHSQVQTHLIGLTMLIDTWKCGVCARQDEKRTTMYSDNKLDRILSTVVFFFFFRGPGTTRWSPVAFVWVFLILSLP